MFRIRKIVESEKEKFACDVSQWINLRSIKKFKAMKKITSLFAIAIAASSLLQGCEEPVTPS